MSILRYTESFVLSIGKGGRLLGWCAIVPGQVGDRAAAGRDAGWCRSTGHRSSDHAAAKRPGRLGHSSGRCGCGTAPSQCQAHSPSATSPPADCRCSRHPPHYAFAPDCPHPSRCRLPAMIALVQGADGGPIGIHRTYIRRDGLAKAAIEPPRAALGPVRGGAVRLDPVATRSSSARASKVAASAGLLLGLPAWSAVSAGNMAIGLTLPPQVRSVVIAADPDEPGRRAADAAWHRWTGEGRRVRINTPKPGAAISTTCSCADGGGTRDRSSTMARDA